MAVIAGAQTLTDFLLARIAEDEAAVNSRTRYLSPGGWSYEEQFGDFGDDERWMIEISASRVLAECEAKRRIVERWQRVSAVAWPADTLKELDLMPEEAAGAEGELSDVLRLLALPYADHPDFQQEWRP